MTIKPASDAVRPFLLVASTPTRPLGAALPAVVTPEVTSPWSPRPVEATLVAPSAAELASVHDEARTRGHAEGVAETLALRARLTELIAQLTAARASIAAPTAAQIAELAGCVIETWTNTTDRSALFAPIVRGWLARSTDQAATVRVHPDDSAALAEAIGDAALTIVPDATLAPGALELRGATLELSHDWPTRLAELRTAIVTALTGVES